MLDIEVAHTAVIPAQATEEVVKNFSRNRQRDLRSAAAARFVECAGDDHDAMYALYEEMLRGELEARKAQRRREEVRALIDIVHMGYGRTIVYRDEAGALASFTLVLGTRCTALQLLIVSSKAARDSGLQAVVQLQAITRSFEQGATLFDFAGGNSRIGAEEKHRYGGRPDLYFRIGFDRR